MLLYYKSEAAVNPNIIAGQYAWSNIIKSTLNKGYSEEVIDLIYKM